MQDWEKQAALGCVASFPLLASGCRRTWSSRMGVARPSMDVICFALAPWSPPRHGCGLGAGRRGMASREGGGEVRDLRARAREQPPPLTEEVCFAAVLLTSVEPPPLVMRQKGTACFCRRARAWDKQPPGAQGTHTMRVGHQRRRRSAAGRERRRPTLGRTPLAFPPPRRQAGRQAGWRRRGGEARRVHLGSALDDPRRAREHAVDVEGHAEVLPQQRRRRPPHGPRTARRLLQDFPETAGAWQAAGARWRVRGDAGLGVARQARQSTKGRLGATAGRAQCGDRDGRTNAAANARLATLFACKDKSVCVNTYSRICVFYMKKISSSNSPPLSSPPSPHIPAFCFHP